MPHSRTSENDKTKNTQKNPHHLSYDRCSRTVIFLLKAGIQEMVPLVLHTVDLGVQETGTFSSF